MHSDQDEHSSRAKGSQGFRLTRTRARVGDQSEPLSPLGAGTNNTAVSDLVEAALDNTDIHLDPRQRRALKHAITDCLDAHNLEIVNRSDHHHETPDHPTFFGANTTTDHPAPSVCVGGGVAQGAVCDG